MCAFSSFIKREPTTYVVQTMGPMTAWRIHYDDLQEVYEKTEDANLMSRLVLEKQYASKIAREKSILELTPEKRYLQLLAERSTILDEIPLKYVASYIGITPEALSRIRKRLSS